MPVLVGIAGGTGSGKTTVARAVAGAFLDRAVLIEQECFYLDRSNTAPEDRFKINYDHPDAIDLNLLLSTIKELKQGMPALIPQYDFTTHTRNKRTTKIGPSDIIVVEGIFVLYYPQLRELLDLKIFVQTDADVRFMRRIKRDMEEHGRPLELIFNQYRKSVKPMHERYVEPTKYYADIILPEGGFNVVGVETIISQVSKMLRYNLR